MRQHGKWRHRPSCGNVVDVEMELYAAGQWRERWRSRASCGGMALLLWYVVVVCGCATVDFSEVLKNDPI